MLFYVLKSLQNNSVSFYELVTDKSNAVNNLTFSVFKRVLPFIFLIFKLISGLR